MAGSIATAYVQVMPSMQGIQGKLEQGFGAEGSKGGKTFGSNLVASAIKVIAAAEIGKTLWSTLNAGAELEQNLGGVQAVYGEFADSISQTAKEAYKTMGLTESAYMATANKMGSLFQGSGITQQKSLELTTKAMQRAADVASVMGIDMSQAMEAVTGAAKGNFTMMDNLGVAMNVATLEAYALEKGINFEWNTASQAEKSELAMEMFFDRTMQYAGNFEREATETFSGAFESMRAAAKNVTARMSLGEDIKPALQELVSTTEIFLTGNFLPAVKNVISHVPDIIRELGGAVADAILGIFGTDLETVVGKLEPIFAPLKSALKEFFSTVAEAAKPLVDAFKEYVQSGRAMEDISNIILPLLEAIAAVLTVLVKMWTVQAKGISLFVQWLNSGSQAAEAVKLVLSAVAQSLLGVLNLLPYIKPIFQSLVNSINSTKEGFNQFVAGLQMLRDGAVQIWQDIKNAIVNEISSIKESFNQFVAGLQMMRDGAVQIWQDITTWAANLAASISGFFTVTIPAAIQSMLTWFQQMATQVSTAFNQTIASAISWVVNFTNKAQEAAQGFVSRLLSGLMTLPQKMLEIGASIVEGIWAGISAGWNWLTSSVANLANSLFESAKAALGINSPSKVFRDGIGRWIPAGIAQGIRNYSGLVTDAIKDLTTYTTSEFTAALRVNTSSRGTGSWETAPGARVVNLVQNIYSQAQTAADQARENRYQMEMAVLLGV